MSGFRMEPKQYNLIFEDPKFNGLEVSLTGMSMQQSLDFDTARFSPFTTVEENSKRARNISDIVVSHVVSWNLTEEDGSSTPQTADGLLSHDGEVQKAIVTAYAKAIRGVSAPLDSGSKNGDEVNSIPMETLPPNL